MLERRQVFLTSSPTASKPQQSTNRSYSLGNQEKSRQPCLIETKQDESLQNCSLNQKKEQITKASCAETVGNENIPSRVSPISEKVHTKLEGAQLAIDSIHKVVPESLKNHSTQEGAEKMQKQSSSGAYIKVGSLQ